MNEIDVSFYKSISGLSRANFISHIGTLSNERVQLLTPRINDLIEYFLDTDMKDYEIIELSRIFLINGLVIDDIYIEKMLDSFIYLIPFVKNIDVKRKVTILIVERVARESNTQKFLKFFLQFLSNAKSVEGLDIITEAISSRLTTLNDWSSINLNELYDILCLITLYNTFEISAQLWKKSIGLFKSADLRLTDGNILLILKNVIHFNEIDTKSIVTFVITALTEKLESQLGTTIYEYSYIVSIIVLFSSREAESITEWHESEKLKQEVQKFAEVKNLEFLNWCINGALTYPNERIGFQNIYLNNRMVLKKETQLLVRGEAEIFVDRAKSCEEQSWIDSNKKYCYEIIDINEETGYMQCFKQKIESKDFISCLKYIADCDKLYKHKYGYVNIFEQGTLCSINDSVFLPHSQFDKKIVTETDCKNNDESSIKELIVKSFINSELKISNLDFGIECLAKNFEDEFIPKFSRASRIDIFQYIADLSIEIDKCITDYPINIYTLEMSKILAIQRYIYRKIKTEKFDLSNSKEITILRMYHLLYHKNRNIEKYLLFSKVEFKDNDLYEYISCFLESFSGNMNYTEINFISEGLRKALYTISEEPNKFKNVKIKEIKSNNQELLIDDKKNELSKLEYIIYGESQNGKHKMTTDKILDVTSRKCFYYNNLIVLLPMWLISCEEIITSKTGQYDKNKLIYDNALKSENNYDIALKNICTQSDIHIQDAEYRIMSFFKNIDVKYHSVILKVIANYKVMQREELDKFVDIIKSYIEMNDTSLCIFPLKAASDNNGFYQIIHNKKDYQSYFDRNGLFDKRINDSIKNFKPDNCIKHLVLLSDLGLSGSQTESTLKRYIENKIANDLNKFENDVFIKTLEQLEKVTFINCLFTEDYKSRIQVFFKQIAPDLKVDFLGIEFDINKHILSLVLSKRELELFTEYLNNNESLLKEEVYYSTKLYSDYVMQIHESTLKNSLVARYKSMPKMHIINFTSKSCIFHYRIDK